MRIAGETSDLMKVHGVLKVEAEAGADGRYTGFIWGLQ
jgi:hypothetical protein